MSLITKVLGMFGYKVIKASSGNWFPITSGSFCNTALEKVNNDTALTVSSLFACIRNVSEDIAKLPLNVYRRDGDYRYEEPAHPLVTILKHRPNPEMTAMSFRETLNAQAMGWGNAYAEIERDVFGKPLYLWPLRPDRIQMMRDRSERLFYRITTDNGQFSDVWAEDIFHLHGLGSDGIGGYNIVLYAAQCIGAAVGMDKFAGAYFSNGLHQSGNLEHPANLSEEAATRLKKQLSDNYSGSSQAHKTLVLEEGMKFSSNIIDPEASQMLETRQFSVTEFCRWLRVPPHKVADLTRATFSNIEEQNIDYVQDGLLGWCERWEQAIRWKLISEPEKMQGYFVKHNVDGLLRGNLKARYEAYSQMWDRGVLSINEIRAKEDLNPIDGGDEHFVPMNFTKLSDAGQEQQTEAVIKDIANRIAKREINAISKRIKYANQDKEKFNKWLNEFYDSHFDFIVQAVEPLRNITVDAEALYLRVFLLSADDPEQVFNDRKDKHADYIANNLRGYYGKV